MVKRVYFIKFRDCSVYLYSNSFNQLYIQKKRVLLILVFVILTFCMLCNVFLILLSFNDCEDNNNFYYTIQPNLIQRS